MIRFRQIHDLTGPFDQKAFAAARRLFREAFPHEPEGIDRVERLLRKRSQRDLDPLLLVSEDSSRAVTGVSFVFYFPEFKIGYLQYIASDPQRPARGIGGALYEATRELVSARGGQGLLFDVPPDTRDKVRDPGLIPTNRRRIRFYERYGARVIEGSGWDTIPNPRNEGYLTLLMFDGMGASARLGRARVRAAVKRILVGQYGYEPSDPFVIKIARSFRDDPVRFRAPHTGATLKPLVGSRRIRPISVVAATGHTIHHVRQRGYVERPVRVRQILKGLEDLPIETVATRHFSDRHVTDVHDPKLVSYLRALSRRLDEKTIVYPEVFPIRRPERAPKALEDRAGYFCADTFTPITKSVYPAARQAVDVALTAAQLIREGERYAYALCRPPGHHAERRIFGGFCYFNNSAIAANYLCRDGKVALLDIDYHHGNGAQDIFYTRDEVLTLSIHGHPRHAYPNFSGYADERGEGAGLGFNRNWPLEPPVDDHRFLRVLERALGAIRRFRPQSLVVSLGFDIMRGDPTGSFDITEAGLARIAGRLASLRLPTLIVQEGGYAVRNLRVGSRSFFGALAATWFTD
ncbi:MAG: histone deacetylase family protein [Alphaproteobacteria bacterium]|nr:histone deacetylase family protein [Alphaproteobacteria bacterium]